MKNIKYLLLLLFPLIIGGCTSTAINVRGGQTSLPWKAHYGVIPFNNNTDRPLAGYRAAAITAGILETMGPAKVSLYQPPIAKNNLISNPNNTISKSTQLNWARRQHIRYLMTGSVNEWRYKVGLDGEPAVNVTLQLYDTNTHRYVWNAVGSSTGGSRSGLSATAQRLIAKLLNYINFV